MAPVLMSTRSPFHARSPFHDIVALESNRQQHRKSYSKHQHAPVDEAGERARIVVEGPPATPVRKGATAHETHQGGAKYAAISHAGHEATNHDYPKCTRLYRSFCCHLPAPQHLNSG